MNFVKKVYRKLGYIIFRIASIIRIVIMSKYYKDKLYLLGVPIHGNLGDQAILLAEEEFLKDNFRNVKIIEVESSVVVKYRSVLAKIAKGKTLLIHGGGFLGSLWPQEENMFRTVLETFPNNKIIVFPQTVYFSKDKEGEEFLEDSIKIYQKHKNLTICCREKFSYDFMKENFQSCNIMLIPDMVLYLDDMEENELRKDILFCIRKDKEKVQYDYNTIKQIVEKNGNIDYTDTVISDRIYTYSNRKKMINKRLNQFSKYKLIVTDRLHGMIFALLSNTPCLVLENKNYKIRGVHDWIKNISYIKLYNKENVETQIKQLLETRINKYDNTIIKEKYNNLIEKIRENI